MDNTKAVAAFLGAPIGGFIIGIVVWSVFKTPDASPNIFGLVGEHLGPWNDPKSAVTAIAGICTVLSWVLIGFLWVNGKDS